MFEVADACGILPCLLGKFGNPLAEHDVFFLVSDQFFAGIVTLASLMICDALCLPRLAFQSLNLRFEAEYLFHMLPLDCFDLILLHILVVVDLVFQCADHLLVGCLTQAGDATEQVSKLIACIASRRHDLVEADVGELNVSLLCRLRIGVDRFLLILEPFRDQFCMLSQHLVAALSGSELSRLRATNFDIF